MSKNWRCANDKCSAYHWWVPDASLAGHPGFGTQILEQIPFVFVPIFGLIYPSGFRTQIPESNPHAFVVQIHLTKSSSKYHVFLHSYLRSKSIFGAGFGVGDLPTKSSTKSFKVFDPPKIRIHHSSHYFPCAIDPWADVDNIIWAGLKLADIAKKQNTYVEQMKTTSQNEHSWSILHELLQCNITFPQIFSVYKTDQIAVKVVIHEMHEGAKEAHATDANKHAKTSYGFNYIDTGCLLCPQMYLSDFNANPQFLQKLADGKVKVMASYWPSFLYSQELHKLDNIESGLMKGNLLSQVFKHIFCSTGDPTKQGGTKHCNVARINQMHKITGHHIAYATCQMRYALCAKDSWTKHDGAFNMDTFYVAIVNLFEEYPEDEWAKATLGWWNEEVFSDAEGCVITNTEKQTHPPKSSVAQMVAARAAHAKACTEAAKMLTADLEANLGAEPEYEDYEDEET
ncbi:hypothetical protein EDD18DRAFT_1108023 [Armillaria luteobubalina]|uniref:Uncharacterized protein n=1 Tax=Armillaria luteobubalina TaxID=153913 RepID=A0AA39Q111_9AGAR|nr:hypothetical protein EDD18DRAFT_1108023 [Armillaria luteobubalina]